MIVQRALFTLLGYVHFVIFVTFATIALPIPYFIASIFSSVPFVYIQRLSKPFLKLYIFTAPIFKVVKTFGKKPVKPVIFVCNHQSILDMMVIMYGQANLLTIAKPYLMKIPLLNIAIMCLGAKFINNSDAKSLMSFYKKIPDYLDQEVSILFFPEGTRMVDERIGKFKSGAFKFSKDYNIPLVPIVLYGTIRIINKSRILSVNCKPQTVYIKYLKEVDPPQFDNIDTYRDHVESLMRAEYERLKNEYYKKLK